MLLGSAGVLAASLSDGTRYEGDGCRPEVEVVLTWPDGTRYVGAFRDGQVVLTWTDRTRYHVALDWLDVTRHVSAFRDGDVALTFADGTRYEGKFRDWQAGGQITLDWPDVMHDMGAFRDGEVALTWADGTRYEGEIRYGQAGGPVVLAWRNVPLTADAFPDGQAGGQGVPTLQDRTRHEGQWLTKPTGYQVAMPAFMRDPGKLATAAIAVVKAVMAVLDAFLSAGEPSADCN